MDLGGAGQGLREPGGGWAVKGDRSGGWSMEEQGGGLGQGWQQVGTERTPEVCPPESSTVGYNTPASSPCEKLLTSTRTGKAFLTTAQKPVYHTLTSQKTGPI